MIDCCFRVTYSSDSVTSFPLCRRELDIHMVAAGGGSRLVVRRGVFVVGPASSVPHPGPVCDRKNRHLAVADVNLLSAEIIPKQFLRTAIEPSRNEADGSSITDREWFGDLRPDNSVNMCVDIFDTFVEGKENKKWEALQRRCLVRPGDIVEHPWPEDVKGGRGGRTSQHLGNKKYFFCVSRKCSLWRQQSDTNTEGKCIREQIEEEVILNTEQNGGLFLKLWNGRQVVMTADEVRFGVRRALRQSVNNDQYVMDRNRRYQEMKTDKAEDQLMEQQSDLDFDFILSWVRHQKGLTHDENIPSLRMSTDSTSCDLLAGLEWKKRVDVDFDEPSDDYADHDCVEGTTCHMKLLSTEKISSDSLTIADSDWVFVDVVEPLTYDTDNDRDEGTTSHEPLISNDSLKSSSTDLSAGLNLDWVFVDVKESTDFLSRDSKSESEFPFLTSIVPTETTADTNEKKAEGSSMTSQEWLDDLTPDNAVHMSADMFDSFVKGEENQKWKVLQRRYLVSSGDIVEYPWSDDVKGGQGGTMFEHHGNTNYCAYLSRNCHLW